MNQQNNIQLATFFEACANGNFAIVQQFIDEGQYNLDIPTKEGWTGLIMACFNEHVTIAKLLLKHGANINATNSKGTTVFMYAKTPIQAKQEQTSFLKYLLDQGANINALDWKGKSVLDYVLENEAFVLADWLVLMGAKKGTEIQSI